MEVRDVYLEKALEELEQLREENDELTRKISVYEHFLEGVKEILYRGEKQSEES